MKCQVAFEGLKRPFFCQAVTKSPGPRITLHHPGFQADASNVAVGAVLLQENEQGKFQPCAYILKKLTDTEQQWAVWEKEAYAACWALLTWHHFLEGSKIPFQV